MMTVTAKHMGGGMSYEYLENLCIGDAISRCSLVKELFSNKDDK